MMTDLTEAALVEAMAREMFRDQIDPSDRHLSNAAFDQLQAGAREHWRDYARAALAAIREAAGVDAEALRRVAQDVEDRDCSAPLAVMDRVADLLRALAGVADG